MSDQLSCFKAYDIRGRVPDELDEELAHAIGRAYVALKGARRVAVGKDMRLSSDAIAGALCEGINAMGADVVDIGLSGTEMIYFAAAHLEAEGVDGGIAVTASHNPADYNGMKLVSAGAVPISGDSGLKDIESMVATGQAPSGSGGGHVETLDIMDAYTDHLLSMVDIPSLKPFTLVTNPGNGCAGMVIDALENRLPFSFHKVHHAPDGTFPNGVPNPLLVENRQPTVDAVLRHEANLGIAWDGDFDRCFFFDHQGEFTDGYYMVGLFAQELLAQHPGSRILYEPRLTWNTIELVSQSGGEAILTKTGHAFIKERMRAEDAVYGGEISAHHYFRDFAYCDSGMIPWLLLTQLMSRTGQSLADLVADRKARFPNSGEINLTIANPTAALAEVRARYGEQAIAFDETDGLAFDFPDWRFNVRMSNTEPVVRLNVETRGDPQLLSQQTDEVVSLLQSLA